MNGSEEIRSASEEATQSFARAFAGRLRAGDVVALSGDLGAGKTVFCRGVALGLGFEGDVHSPSYALVHEYPGARLPLFHMDLYRLAPGSDWQEIGLDHYFRQGGVCLVEWPERLPPEFGFAWRISLATVATASTAADGPNEAYDADRAEAAAGKDGTGGADAPDAVDDADTRIIRVLRG